MMKTILFQGDSITDCCRDRSGAQTGLGLGYAFQVASDLGCAAPGAYRFYNRGISGNRIVDLYARIKSDFINLAPDYLSILIGVNDVWHERGSQNGVDAPKFERIYDMLLEEIYAARPDVKIMLLAPFVIPGGATVNTEELPDRWDYFRYEVDLRVEAVRRLGEKYGLPVIYLQKTFDEALARYAEPSHWSFDGVHPTPFGHRLIADEWEKVFKTLS